MAAAAANSIAKAMNIAIHTELTGGSRGITAGTDAPAV